MAAVASAGIDYGPEFGLDDHLTIRRWFGRAAWAAVIGVGVWFINHNEYPGPSVRVLAVLLLIALACCAIAWLKMQYGREGKFQLRDRLLDGLGLKDDDKILEVGCGAGLLAIGAAKRLKSGKVTAVDNWESNDPAISAARENAKKEGVGDKVRIEASPTGKLVYPENHFDAVVSSRYLLQLLDHRERSRALGEMYRVLKPGGRLLVFDSGDIDYYGQVLREAGAKDVTISPWSFPWCVPHRSVSARK